MFIQTLVYILILGLLLGAVFINQLAVMTSWFYVLRAERSLIQSATLAIERIIRETRQAQNIDFANSFFSSGLGAFFEIVDRFENSFSHSSFIRCYEKEETELSN